MITWEGSAERIQQHIKNNLRKMIVMGTLPVNDSLLNTTPPANNSVLTGIVPQGRSHFRPHIAKEDLFLNAFKCHLQNLDPDLKNERDFRILKLCGFDISSLY